jgi:hypothetical protein
MLESKAAAVYYGSCGENTKHLYALLEGKGLAGVVALNLFRACKNSARAKIYRGGIRGQGSYKSKAYDRKQWAMRNLCKVLTEHAGDLGIQWGWKQDPAQEYHKWVLYVAIPTGQVSFHTSERGTGPDYAGDWDGEHQSAERIIEWVDNILTEKTDSEQRTLDI